MIQTSIPPAINSACLTSSLRTMILILALAESRRFQSILIFCLMALLIQSQLSKSVSFHPHQLNNKFHLLSYTSLLFSFVKRLFTLNYVVQQTISLDFTFTVSITIPP